MPCGGRCSPQIEEVQKRWYSFGDQRNCSPIDNDDHSRPHSCRTNKPPKANGENVRKKGRKSISHEKVFGIGTNHFTVARPRWAISIACGTVFHTNTNNEKFDL